MSISSLLCLVTCSVVVMKVQRKEPNDLPSLEFQPSRSWEFCRKIPFEASQAVFWSISGVDFVKLLQVLYTSVAIVFKSGNNS